MRHKILYVLVICVLLAHLPAVARSSSHSGHSTHSSKSSKNSTGKTEHVNGYYRKDGTYVAPYNRHPAGTAPHDAAAPPDLGAPHSTAAPVNAPTPNIAYRYKKGYVAESYAADSSVVRDKHGKIKRSQAAKDEFKREHPCPANGNGSGKCPGYVIDHVRPLECGGADAPSNMQWQTVAEGKAKDKTEGYCR